MSTDVFTREQRDWGNHFEKYLVGGSGARPDGDTNGEEEVAEYGKGFEKLKMSLPKPLESGIEQQLKADRPRMIGKDLWDQAQVVPSAEERQGFLEKNQITQKMTAMIEADKLFDYWNQVAIRLRDSGKDKKGKKGEKEWQDCDLTKIAPPQGLQLTPPLDKLLSNRPIPAGEVEELLKQVASKHDEADQEREKYQAVVGECQKFLDAPENNPEREKVGVLLGQLELIEKTIPQTGLDQPLAKTKMDKLAELEKTLYGWIDRRTAQNLPPTAESVALSDLLQKVHQDVVAEVLKQELDLPIPGADQLPEEEQKKAQQLWKSITGGKGPITLSLERPAVHEKEKMAKNAQFRKEVYSNFARLLGSDAGRQLLSRLNDSPKPITFRIGDQCSCTASDTDESRPSDLSSLEQARKTRGAGSGCSVMMPLGMMDSDKIMTTRSGDVLFSPTHVILGHELVHGLHDLEGESLARMAPPGNEDPKWNNMEEFLTISGPGLSEQTLRQQYGLSAERFGHYATQPDRPVAQAIQEEVLAMAELEEANRKPPTVDELLVGRGFPNPERIPARLKRDLHKEQALKGPLPDGWDPAQLDIDQVKAMLAAPNDFPFERFENLGWKPFGLPAAQGEDNLKGLIATQRHHRRSPLGQKYHQLGGDPAVEAVRAFVEATACSLPVVNDNNWPTRVAALDAAEKWFKEKAAHLIAPGTPLAKKCQAFLGALKSTGEVPPKTVEGQLELLGRAQQTAAKEPGMPPTFDGVADTLEFFEYKGEANVKAQMVFLGERREELSKRDKELEALGHDPKALPLAARGRLVKLIDQLATAGSPQAVTGLLAGPCRDLLQPKGLAKKILQEYDKFAEISEELQGKADNCQLEELRDGLTTTWGGQQKTLEQQIENVKLDSLQKALLTQLHDSLGPRRGSFVDQFQQLRGLTEQLKKAGTPELPGLLRGPCGNVVMPRGVAASVLQAYDPFDALELQLQQHVNGDKLDELETGIKTTWTDQMKTLKQEIDKVQLKTFKTLLTTRLYDPRKDRLGIFIQELMRIRRATAPQRAGLLVDKLVQDAPQIVGRLEQLKGQYKEGKAISKELLTLAKKATGPKKDLTAINKLLVTAVQNAEGQIKAYRSRLQLPEGTQDAAVVETQALIDRYTEISKVILEA